jgi:Holliday junction resolvasome RuvABC ATP-dependent DNA helicase subunit
MVSLINLFRNQISKALVYQRTPDIFDEIIGYDDLKHVLRLALSSEYSISILLAGNPGNGKSSFLQCMEKNYLGHSLYLDCTMMTKSGLFDLLSNNKKVKILLLDEISLLKKVDQGILLNLLQSGVLIDTKYKRHNELKLKSLKVFATCNDTERLISPLSNRFDKFVLPDYTYDEFREIGFKIIRKKEQSLKELIIDSVWYELESKSIRDLINLSKYVTNYQDLELFISIKRKYGTDRKLPGFDR